MPLTVNEVHSNNTVNLQSYILLQWIICMQSKMKIHHSWKSSELSWIFH